MNASSLCNSEKGFGRFWRSNVRKLSQRMLSLTRDCIMETSSRSLSEPLSTSWLEQGANETVTVPVAVPKSGAVWLSCVTKKILSSDPFVNSIRKKPVVTICATTAFNDLNPYSFHSRPLFIFFNCAPSRDKLNGRSKPTVCQAVMSIVWIALS